MAALCAKLALFLEEAANRANSCLPHSASEFVSYTWSLLLEEGNRLRKAWIMMPTDTLPVQMQSTAGHMQATLVSGSAGATAVAAALPTPVLRSMVQLQPRALRLACGSPGLNGCLTPNGVVAWSILRKSAYSVGAAFSELDLDAIGLVGARLSTSFVMPLHADFIVHARGGPAYGSTAVAIRKRSRSLFEILDLPGGERRMWIKICGVDTVLFWLVLYWPPSNSRANDDIWRQELDLVGKDVAA